MELNKCREKIDEIDKELIRLFEERMEIVLKVAKYKQEKKLPVFNKKREEQVIIKNLNGINNDEIKPYVKEMLHSLMDISKKYQCKKIGLREIPLNKSNEIKIGFQGLEGSFSEEALIAYFGEGYETCSYEKFEEVFEGLKYRNIDYGILPIENSSTGSITEIYDLLKKYGFYIVGETKIKIEHNLLGIKGTKIKEINEVYSHPQGFEQSSEYLKTLDCINIPYYNTAISAKYVKDNNNFNKGAIGSKRAAKIYGLEVLKEGINNVKENFTRFIIVGKNLESNEVCNKMTISFTLPNESGSLYNQLRVFSEANINLIKIESRPVGDGTFSYIFYIDIEGNIKDIVVKKVLEKVSELTCQFRILGCYKKFNDIIH
ncbi:prephenate dehydratase [Clostridium tarantellae]|uniref:Bifunctional chorismate mutase/prephenate dehydratase n=1 Tax=Clostridium tarantellae TaxID=39493 RepID=A0A6I1MQ31_9CLOT|nr:prephenate dehydratase [Clostridium tarantellae]MPQ44588.1 prephenate dehydratase [Clostridium tarantellae]